MKITTSQHLSDDSVFSVQIEPQIRLQGEACSFSMRRADYAHIAKFIVVYARIMGFSQVNVVPSQNSVGFTQLLRELARELISIKERSLLYACLLAGGIGDAFGYKIELYCTIKQLASQKRVQYQQTCSDDTQMTIFSLFSLNSDPYTEYQNWYKCINNQANPAGSRSPALQQCQGPGKTCMSALKSRTFPAQNNSDGCGTIMRVAPFALFASSQDRAFNNAYSSSCSTHGGKEGLLAAGLFASILYRILKENAAQDSDCRAYVKQILDTNLEELIPPNYRASYQSSQLKRLVEQQLESKLHRPPLNPYSDYYQSDYFKAFRSIGEGFIAQETLPLALYAFRCFLQHKDELTFQNLLEMSAYTTGDSDSIAGLAGQLYGVTFGLRDIPLSVICRLDLSEEILFGISSAKPQ